MYYLIIQMNMSKFSWRYFDENAHYDFDADSIKHFHLVQYSGITH